MKEHEQLLKEARDFCDPTTGEVLQRIPEELINQLRAAKLAKGIPGGRSERTETYATWFVFFSDDIREEVLAKWREANRQRRRRRSAGAKKTNPEPVAAGVGSQARQSTNRGLHQFRQRKNSAK